MAKYLLIVESPTKVKAIKKFLGKNYEVAASNGHVRDLPKSQMGIDIEHDFEPKYITIRGKGDILSALRKEVKKADMVYLATDPDREGEAISWHLVQALKLEEGNYQRITFNEITKNAVKAALKEPRDIDTDLVNAQQARRVLDRLVGYEISPLLWIKVKRGLSAGRVQSAALRIIADREDEISEFIPSEYWTLDAVIRPTGEKKDLVARYHGANGRKVTIKSKEQMDSILAELENAEWKILETKSGSRSKNPPLPFTTSTLQQDASRFLNFSTQKTMRVAQQLYEGIDVKGYGTVGLITYLRTDSTRISDDARAAAEAFITEQYGKENLGKYRQNAKNGRIQDAHEAIRPSDINRTPVRIKEYLTRDQFRLYQLIWNRFTASQMAPAVYETSQITIGAGVHRFNAAASKVTFAGYQNVFSLDEEKSENTHISRNLTTETSLEKKDLKSEQHFTQPPAHYTEATLVRTMEELGIGRPSTYAPTITTLLTRHYILKEGRNLFVSELGEAVNKIMKDAFPEIVDVTFTANIETLLDSVEEGTFDWKEIIRNFYPDLRREIDAANQDLEKVKIEDEVTDEICENCGRHMVIKYGPHGKFLACPGFPECKNTRPYLEKLDVNCPKCGRKIVIRKTKKGRRFYGCELYPECDFTSWQKPSATPCPKCGSYMVEKGSKLMCSDQNCGYVTKKS